MAHRDEILAAADELLSAADYHDYCPNGLQVAGAEQVTTIATAVSCTLEVFERAAGLGAQLLIAHHGLFWKNTPQVIDSHMRARLQALFASSMTLAGYHLPLDAHRELGNNSLIARGLGLELETTPFAIIGGRQIGYVASAPTPLSLDELAGRLASLTGREPLVLGARPERITRIAICSGGAASEAAAAASLGADALITGEADEPTHADARERGIAVLAGGHYATETFGVRALGEHLASQFGLAHHFIEVANPV